MELFVIFIAILSTVQSTLPALAINSTPSIASQRQFTESSSTTLATANRTGVLNTGSPHRTTYSIEHGKISTPNTIQHPVAYSTTPSPNRTAETSTLPQSTRIATTKERTTISDNPESELFRTHLISDMTTAVTDRSVVKTTLQNGVVSHSRSPEPMFGSRTSLAAHVTVDGLPSVSTTEISVVDSNYTNDIPSTTSVDISVFETSSKSANESGSKQVDRTTVGSIDFATTMTNLEPNTGLMTVIPTGVSQQGLKETTQLEGTEVLEVTDAITSEPDLQQRPTSVSDFSPLGSDYTYARDMDSETSATTRTMETPSDVSTLGESSSRADSITLPTDLMVQSETSVALSSTPEEAATAFDTTTLETVTSLDGQLSNATSVNALATSVGSSSGANGTGFASIAGTNDWITETELVEVTTYIVAEGTPSGSVEPWSSEVSSAEGTDFNTTEDSFVSSYDPFLGTEPTTSSVGTELPEVPSPCLCNVTVAVASAKVCLCNSSLAASNYSYSIQLLRRVGTANQTDDVLMDAAFGTRLLDVGGGCWNVSVPLGGDYQLEVTASDGYGRNATTPTPYFKSGLLPPYLSIGQVPGSLTPSLEVVWTFPYPTYVDYVTIYLSKNDAVATQLTWMKVSGVQRQGSFTFVAVDMGSKYSVAVTIQSAELSVSSNYDTAVLPPHQPEDVQVVHIETREISVHWSNNRSCPSCTYVVRYGETASRHNDKEFPVTCPRSQNGAYRCTAYIHGLLPGTLYTIDVYAASYRVLSKTAAQVSARTYPAPPRNISLVDATAHSLSLSWAHGAGSRTSYHLQAYDSTSPYSQDMGVVSGDVTQFTFHNLLAGTHYVIIIKARAESTYGERAVAEGKTLAIKPGAVEDLSAEALSSAHQVRLSFLSPINPNGALRGFQIQYVGMRAQANNMCSTGQIDLQVSQKTVIIDQLKGGCNYTFTVRARNEVGLGPGVSVSYVTSVGVPVMPETRPPQPDTATVRTTGFTVNFDPNIFDDVTGEITHVAVIVAQEEGASGPEQGNNTRPRMQTWADAITHDVIHPYQISDPITLDVPNSARHRRDTGPRPIAVEVGTAECSREERDIYCNGPLPQGRSYVYRFRGMSAGGYADTKFSLPVVLPLSPQGVIIGISTALFSLLVIVIILSIIVIVRKFRLDGRGHYHPASMKDVELSRVANNHQYAATLSKQKYTRPVRLSDFARDWFHMNADSHCAYSQEYESIRKVGRKMTMNVAVSPSNVGKNRYTNILPYDRTRVKLGGVDDIDGTDYINANYIPGFSSPREYIACQGPLPSTVDDMWRMIWEQNVSTVVMVTQLVEKGKVKCDQYWPDDHKPVLYGDVQVTMTQALEENDWNIKDFVVQMRDQQRHVRHWNFLSWPDHGVPESSGALLSFIRRVRGAVRGSSPSASSPASPGPVVVHCSAGVGRTGTFIILDRLLQHMIEYDFVDIMGIVCEMRMHRNFMVQTEQQYVFIHRCILDVLEERGGTSMPMTSLTLP